MNIFARISFLSFLLLNFIANSSEKLKEQENLGQDNFKETIYSALNKILIPDLINLATEYAQGNIILADESLVDKALVLRSFLPNGLVDNSFGNAGKVITKFLLRTHGYFIIVNSEINGQILVIECLAMPHKFHNEVASYLIDGQPNLQFANIKWPSYFRVINAKFSDNGKKLYITGVEAGKGSQIWGFDKNGNIDLSFGSGGYQNIDLTGDSILAVKDNDIFVAGFSQIIRLSNQGTILNQFGSIKDLNILPRFGNDLQVIKLVPLRNKKIIAIYKDPDNSLKLRKFDYETGKLDKYFGTNGFVAIKGICNNTFVSLASQNDKILVAGTPKYDSNIIVIRRYNNDGTNADSIGKKIIPSDQKQGFVKDIQIFTVDYEGNILIGGNLTDLNQTLKDKHFLFKFDKNLKEIPISNWNLDKSNMSLFE